MLIAVTRGASAPGDEPLPGHDEDVVAVWLRRVTPGADVIVELAAEVARRLRAGGPRWLAAQPLQLQQRFFVAQVVLEHRGVLPARGRPTGTGEP